MIILNKIADEIKAKPNTIMIGMSDLERTDANMSQKSDLLCDLLC
jgi:hypothetical protein